MAKRTKAKPLINIDEMAKAIAEGLHRTAVTPNIWGYKPHDKQVKFHKSTARRRLYIGGNRSGKTVGGCVEDIWWLMGNHPYRETPEPPVRGRIIGVDFDNGIDRILKPQIARWLPPSALINGSWEDSYEAGSRTLSLDNGSQVEFMSYVQDVHKFAGTSRHFIHYDEEPPKSIHIENWARIVDTGGSMWFTMTPVNGMTWIYDDIYIPGITDNVPNIDVIIVDVTENPYVSPIEIEEFLSGLDSNERQARKEGRFVQLGGLIFPIFGPYHIVDSIYPKSLHDLRWFVSMDDGMNNATSFHWHAIYPDGSVLTFMEHYTNEWTVKQHAERIHLINSELGRVPNCYVGDPSIKKRSTNNGLSVQVTYQQNGISIIPADNQVRAGIDKMKTYLMPDKTGRCMWRITNNCPNLIYQMKRYRWKVHKSPKVREENNPLEEPHPYQNHCVDDCRYFFSFMPDLSIKPRESDMQQRLMEMDRMVGAKPIHPNIEKRVDRTLSTQWRSGQSTQWTEAYDSTVGVF